MAQIHSYLVINARSELKYVNEEITPEELDETFNQIALSMASGSDLFDNNDNDDDEINEIDFIPENYELDDEAVDLEGIDNNSLEINNFIDFSASILNSDSSIEEEDETSAEVSINHGDPDFDIDEMINRFSINID